MVIVGNSYSTVDISRDIARFAKEVHVSDRSRTDEPRRKQPGYDNMWLHSSVEDFLLDVI